MNTDTELRFIDPRIASTAPSPDPLEFTTDKLLAEYIRAVLHQSHLPANRVPRAGVGLADKV